MDAACAYVTSVFREVNRKGGTTVWFPENAGNNARNAGRQVRSAFGLTDAPGCLDDDGRLSWARIKARLGVGAAASPQAPAAARVPDALANTVPGRLYALLLEWGPGGVLPAADGIGEALGLQSFETRTIVRLVGVALRGLEKRGLIAAVALRGGGREVTLLETGQVLVTPPGGAARRA